MDLAKDSEIDYLRDSLNLQDKEFYLTNALSGENLDKLIDDLKERYWGNA
jgi:hypothetical protein